MLGQGNVDKSRDQKETCGSTEGLQNGHRTYILAFFEIPSDYFGLFQNEGGAERACRCNLYKHGLVTHRTKR